MSRTRLSALLGTLTLLSLTSTAQATVIDVTIDGSDAIWLAGRTDLAIPPTNQSWPTGMIRHGNPTPEEILETLPPGYGVQAGDVVRVLDPADGGISFFNGFGGIVYGPQGNSTPGSSQISSFGGISGYVGTQGALVGVFLDNSIPNGSAPTTLNFSNGGIDPLGVDFTSLSPGLGQIFFIGDGQTGGGVFQEFIAPTGSTRLFLGVPDSFNFNGPPGAYDDNDGAYRIRLGINEDPRNPVTVPEPAPLLMLLSGLLLLAYRRVPSRSVR